MRVIAGTARGRLLRAPSGAGTRPTSDRVREAVFDMLSSLGVLEGARVLDLFSGSGACGIESLSRGAESAVLVDVDAGAVVAARRNLEVLGEERRRAEVVRADAMAYLAGGRAAGASSGRSGDAGDRAGEAAGGRAEERFDVVFADPPYRFDGWPELLPRLAACTGLLVAETGWDRAEVWSPGPGWETVKVKRYGGTVVCIARPFPVPPAPVPAEEGDS